MQLSDGQKGVLIFLGAVAVLVMLGTWWNGERDRGSHMEIITIEDKVTVDKYTECVLKVNGNLQYTDDRPCLWKIGDKVKVQVYSKMYDDWAIRGKA